MRKMKAILLLVALSTSAFASQIGLSTHPFEAEKQVITTEFAGYLSNGSGMGLNARYYNRLDEKLNIDAGFGIGEGERENRFFAGADYTLFPDYGNQPRMSMKAMFETAKEFDERHNKFGAAPTISKGFNFWGKEAFPYLAIPAVVDLNSEKGTYDIATALTMGISGEIPRTKARMVANAEAQIGLSNSYSSIVVGLSIPVN